jgi:c-di-GMP-related signal transduction protein
MANTGADQAVDLYVARQPIFDAANRVVAYELLFRSGSENFFTWTSPDLSVPTTRVISSGMFVGMRTLTDGRLAFLNFGREAIVGGLCYALPPSETVVEVLETVSPDAEVVSALRGLKDAGYRIALDDFEDRDDYAPLVELADFLKVDVLATRRTRTAAIARRYRSAERAVLAEKVETREVFAETLRQGYQYFQGYYFARPVIMSSKTITGYRLNYLRLLNELNQPDTDIQRLEDIVKQEVSLSFRFLQRVNSAAYGFRQTAETLRHALVLLGEREIRMCATIWALADLAQDTPPEIIITSTLRARLCELLAPSASLGHAASALFLVGAFSMLDVILQRPMASVVSDLPVNPDVREALLGQRNELGKVLAAVMAYERGDWQRSAALSADAGLDDRDLPACYVKAIEWTRDVFQQAAVQPRPS